MGLWKTISNILLIKSFVLGVLIIGLWVRSSFVADSISAETGRKSTSLTSANGVVVYRASADGSDDLSINRVKRHYSQTDPDLITAMLPSHPNLSQNLGFSYHRAVLSDENGGLAITLTMPHWFFLLLSSSKAIVWLARKGVRSIAAKSPQAGWCAICQADQPQVSGRCNHCGSMVFNRSA